MKMKTHKFLIEFESNKETPQGAISMKTLGNLLKAIDEAAKKFDFRAGFKWTPKKKPPKETTSD